MYTPSQSYPYVARACMSVVFSCQTAESPKFHLKGEGRERGGGRESREEDGGRKEERGGEGET